MNFREKSRVYENRLERAESQRIEEVEDAADEYSRQERAIEYADHRRKEKREVGE